ANEGRNFWFRPEVCPRLLRIIRPSISTKIVPECSAMSFKRSLLDRPPPARGLIRFLLKCGIISIESRISGHQIYDQIKCSSARRIAASAADAWHHYYLAWLSKTHSSQRHVWHVCTTRAAWLF